MRRLRISINLSLDGFVADKAGNLNWHFRYWNEDMSDAMLYLLNCTDTLLFGRKTYEGMAEYWQRKSTAFGRPDEDMPLAQSLNYCKKIVFSSNSNLPYWINAQIESGDLIKTVKKLKAKEGDDILILGSPSIIAPLAKYNLIDNYHLWIHPVIVGSGRRFFPHSNFPLHLKLLQSKSLRNGVTRITLQPAGRSDSYGIIPDRDFTLYTPQNMNM